MVEKFKRIIVSLMAALTIIGVFAGVSLLQAAPFVLFLAFYFLKEYREKEWAGIVMGVIAVGMSLLNWQYQSWIDVIVWVLAFIISLI